MKQISFNKANGLLNKCRNFIKLLTCIDSVDFLNKDTVSVSFSKNLVVCNTMNTVYINKGYSINISKQIHLNPKISLREFYSSPCNIQKQIDESVKPISEEKCTFLER